GALPEAAAVRAPHTTSRSLEPVRAEPFDRLRTGLSKPPALRQAQCERKEAEPDSYRIDLTWYQLASRQASPGMMRRMNSSNSGTVKAVSPWFGLQTMPLSMSWARIGPSDVTLRCRPS